MSPVSNQNNIKRNPPVKSVEGTKGQQKRGIIIFSTVAATAASALAIGSLMYIKKNRSTVYIRTLARDMTTALGEKVSVKQLKSVMLPDEVFASMRQMKRENYSPKGNLENGIFKIDLHSHSNYSDGVGSVQSLLEQAVEYGNKLHSITGEKFIFALSDHDEIAGTKEALIILAKNPKKYENIRFVPAAELSFVHLSEKTGNPTECSELLVHGINPFSKNLNRMIENLQRKRSNMIKDSLAELSAQITDVRFLPEEMNGFYLKTPNENFAYNLHWRVYNYAQVKQRVARIAKQRGENPETLYKNLMQEFKVNKNARTPSNFDKFLSENAIYTDVPKEDSVVGKICNKYFPHVDNGNITAAGENTFNDIITAVEKEKDVCLGLAHPYFLARNFNNPQQAIQNFIDESKGYLKTAEEYHQSYPAWIAAEEINKVNEIIRNMKLMPFGGQDNHSPNIIKNSYS